MSLLERAFSFLNCTCCGKFFGYNEKVFSCENRRNRNCFDHEAVCGKCMHDHAESIHVMDKQRYIVALRHDIEEKIRDFINKMETKLFDGSIGPLIDRSIVMAEVEASKAESVDFAEVAERRKAKLLQLRSVYNGSFGLKVAQPKSLSGTSTTSVAVESVLEKEVVAEEPKKLDFPGIDLKVWEETKWPMIKKHQEALANQEVLAKLEQMYRLLSARLQPDKTAQSTSSFDPIKVMPLPSFDPSMVMPLPVWKETKWPIIKKRQEDEAKQEQMQAYHSARLQPDKTAQSIPPGDIITQPNAKVVFNAPYDDKHTHDIKLINAGGRRIGWAIKTSNMKRLGVDLPCGVLDPKEGVLVAVSCDAFAFGHEETNNDRIIIEWTNTPDGATKQFRREWFQGDGMVRRKNLPIEYNP
ncbi:unnamed protein product, partial [Mesorhabditis belari]|uniref:Major sperm protein n=1 Tax=Mesorhabditis belari TaxID=2138241 RepID=A0AAF3FDV0_9BILA